MGGMGGCTELFRALVRPPFFGAVLQLYLEAQSSFDYLLWKLWDKLHILQELVFFIILLSLCSLLLLVYGMFR